MVQWRYHTANSWGTDENGSGLGHGYQEEFYGCADIEIINTNGKPTDAPTTKPTTKPTTTTTTTTTKQSTTKSTTTTKKTTTTTKIETSKPMPPSNEENPCEGQTAGYYPHPDCSKYYQCDHGTALERECASGLHYNPSIMGCDWPQNANCATQ